MYETVLIFHDTYTAIFFNIICFVVIVPVKLLFCMQLEIDLKRLLPDRFMGGKRVDSVNFPTDRQRVHM